MSNIKSLHGRYIVFIEITLSIDGDIAPSCIWNILLQIEIILTQKKLFKIVEITKKNPLNYTFAPLNFNIHKCNFTGKNTCEYLFSKDVKQYILSIIIIIIYFIDYKIF